ncbi:MAG: DUF3795 domain-containing protein [Desulfobaccales bacterium]
MKESYCGLCDQCQLEHPEFLAAVSTVKSFVDQFRVYWWAHCFWGDEGFSLPEFRRGLEWFLSHPQCPGCRGRSAQDRCPIRTCAIKRGYEHCHECPDLEQCDRFDLILQEYPDHKRKLLRLQQKIGARKAVI